VNWNTNGLVGTKKFLDKVERLFGDNSDVAVRADKKVLSLLHKTIKKVGVDIENFRLNTAVSSLMILVNELTDYKAKNQAWPFAVKDGLSLLQILAPFAPHLSEELWARWGNKDSIFRSVWPLCDESLMKDDIVNLVVQINGKLRASLETPADINEDDAVSLAKANDNVRKWLEGKEIVKIIFVPGKLLNIVIK